MIRHLNGTTTKLNGVYYSMLNVIQNQFCVRTVFLDRSDVGFAHVAAGPLDTGSLVWADRFCEEPQQELSSYEMSATIHQNQLWWSATYSSWG